MKAGDMAAARAAFERALEIRQALAAADKTDLEAKLDVVRSILLFDRLPVDARGPAHIKRLRAAKATLDAKAAKGQIAGDEAREKIRDKVLSALAEPRR